MVPACGFWSSGQSAPRRRAAVRAHRELHARADARAARAAGGRSGSARGPAPVVHVSRNGRCGALGRASRRSSPTWIRAPGTCSTGSARGALAARRARSRPWSPARPLGPAPLAVSQAWGPLVLRRRRAACWWTPPPASARSTSAAPRWAARATPRSSPSMPRSRSRSARGAPSPHGARSWPRRCVASRTSASARTGPSKRARPQRKARRVARRHGARRPDSLDAVLGARRTHAGHIRGGLAAHGYEFQHGSELGTWQFVPVLAPDARAPRGRAHTRARG